MKRIGNLHITTHGGAVLEILDFNVRESRRRPVTNRESRNLSSLEPTRYISNLSQIVANLGYDVKEFRSTLMEISNPPNLSRGARHRLYRWLNDNPSIYQANLSKTPLIPYLIEDCLNPRVLPVDISRYFGPIRIGENPYSLLSHYNLLRISHIRDIMVDPDHLAEALNEYDSITGPWLIQYLNMTPEDMWNYTKSMDVDRMDFLPKLGYYCACRGVTIPTYNAAIMSMKTYYSSCLAACEIYDAGDGLGQMVENAIPYPMSLLVDIKHTYGLWSLWTNDEYDHMSHKTIWCKIFGIRDLGLLSKDGFIEVFTRGYISPLPIDPKAHQRYEMYQALTPAQQDLMARIYNNPSLTAAKFAKEHSPILLEAGVRHFTEENMESLAEYLGMIFPLHASTRELKREYFFESISLYSRIVDSSGNFQRDHHEGPLLTDRQIILSLGGQVMYNNRTELERIFVDMLSKDTKQDPVKRHFFIPFDRRSINQKTLTSFEETRSHELLLVGFGTSSSYVCHEISELAGYMDPSISDVYQYRILGLDGKYQPLTPDQAIELRLLLSGLLTRLKSDDITHSNQLIQHINHVTQFIKANDLYTKLITDQFKHMTLETQELIHNYLYKIFELGMYMRRWKGPGYPYPLNRSYTERSDFNPDTDLQLPISKVWEATKNLDPATIEFMHSLRMVEFKDGAFSHRATTTMYIIYRNTLINNDDINTCIRMASANLVISSYYYLDLFYNELLQGFNHLRLDLIT
jgi:hypothetical protein